MIRDLVFCLYFWIGLGWLSMSFTQRTGCLLINKE